jgi:signal transduction histidine kinase
MSRGDFKIGELSLEGSDGLAFDPQHSAEWADCVRSISRCLELLCLRDFVSIQQGFLAVGRMQSLLAHEMKNPLAIIKVCSGILTSHIQGDEEAEELLKTIQDEVRRISIGIQHVFDQSAQTGQKSRVNLSQIFEEIRTSVFQRFSNTILEFSMWKNGEKQPTQEALLWVWMDREGLMQTLRNLIINAFEAKATKVEIEVHQTDQQLSLIVRDNGGGIAEELDLFKPFMTTKPQGTGLGLTNVKAFVDQNGGQIRVQTKRKEGTTFILDFSKQFVMNGEV